MTWKTRGTAISLTVLLAFTGLSLPSTAESDRHIYEGHLLWSIPETEKEDCRVWSNCDRYQGIALTDVDITHVMEDDDEEAQAGAYMLFDPGLTGLLTEWTLCKYTADKALLGCDYNLWSNGKKGGDLPDETRHLRLIAMDGVAPEYWLKVAN